MNMIHWKILEKNFMLMKIRSTPSFKKALKRYKKKHYSLNLLDECITAIATNDSKILKKHRAHKLTKKFELHITDDWLLIYDFDSTTGVLILVLVTMGNHDDLKKLADI